VVAGHRTGVPGALVHPDVMLLNVAVTQDSTLDGTVTFPDVKDIPMLTVLLGKTPITTSAHSLTFPALMKYQVPVASVIETHPVEFVMYEVRGQGGKVVVLPFETTVPLAPTVDPLGTWWTHSVIVGPPGVSTTSFGVGIGPANTVIPATGDIVGPSTTRTRKVAPVPEADEPVVLVALSVLPLPDKLCMAVTATTDVMMTTIKRDRAIVLAIALCERPLAPGALAEVIRMECTSSRY
jgi:hypothetical protein